MSINYRKGRNKPYQVMWRNPYTKKQETQSFATKQEAKKAESLIQYKLNFEKESFIPKKEEAVESEVSLGEIYTAYLAEKKFSLKSIYWQAAGMKIPLKLFGNKKITAITSKDLAVILRETTTDKVKPATVCSKMRVLYTLIRWAVKRGYLETAPRFPELPSFKYERFVPPSDEEAYRIYMAAADHVKRVIIIGAKLGLRVGPCELFKLKWEDVDLEKGFVRVHASRKNPNEPLREVPIKDSLIEVFREWIKSDMLAGMEYVIHYHGKPVTQINVAWHNALKEAGITRRIRPYDLRHAFATDAISAGADVGTVAKLMGHSSPVMVLKCYQHVMTKQKKAAVELLPDFPQMLTKGVDQKKELIQ